MPHDDTPPPTAAKPPKPSATRPVPVAEKAPPIVSAPDDDATVTPLLKRSSWAYREHEFDDHARGIPQPGWKDLMLEGGPAPSELGRIVGHIPVHELDEPMSVLRRAAGALAGHIPVGKASRFRADALLRTESGEIPYGTEFDASRLSPADRDRFWKAGALIPVA